MSVANVLVYLNGELARHGADIVSGTDLATLAAVERHLDDPNLPNADIARAVAWTASLIPGAERDAFETTFGEVAANLLGVLIPTKALEPIPALDVRGMGRSNIRIAWARATKHTDIQVRRIAVALLAGEAEKAADPDDRKQLGEILDIAVEHATDEAVRARLTEVRGQLAPIDADQAETAAMPSPTRLISMSIDVVGSTQAKRRLRDLAGDRARRNQLYEGFHASFLREEDRFYTDLFAPGLWDRGPPLDWRRLFVVKGIGDELWLTYDVTPAEGVDADTFLRQAAVRLISAALSLVERTVTCGGTAEDLGPHLDHAAEERQAHDRMDLPFKVTIDLIHDAIEISGQRLEYFAGRVGPYLSPPRQDTGPGRPAPFGAAHAEILRRLNAGHFELTGGHRVRQTFRTDFIGPDIDRFFRITKFALPGLVMVGEDLMQVLRFDVSERYQDTDITVRDGAQDAPEQPKPRFDRIALTFPCDLHRPDSYVAVRGEFIRRLRPIEKGDMKGVDAPYAVHHLIGIPSFRRLVRDAASNLLLRQSADEYPRSLRVLITPRGAGEAADEGEQAG